jgi:hypothetical protein
MVRAWTSKASHVPAQNTTVEPTMKRLHSVRLIVLAAALASPAFANEGATGGRTDGPEGSEIGYGGYSRSGGGAFSLQLDWGAAFPALTPVRVPMYVGLTAGFWVDEWFVVEGSVLHAFSNRTEILLGPRFRTVTYPASLSIGVKAGAMIFPGLAAFGIAPQIGADFLVRDHFLMGINYALDLAFVRTTFSPTSNNVLVGHRIWLGVGYRF